MIEWIKLRSSSKADSSNEVEYEKCIKDLIRHDKVVSMKSFVQHGAISCLEHCIYVSYISYLVCRRLGWDYRSAARGGLLHDFFLYDWHTTKLEEGLHGFVHPAIALKNAEKHFVLNAREKDIILKHMWPLTLRLPKYKEAFVVLLVDKYCATMEVFNWINMKKLYRLREIAGFRI